MSGTETAGAAPAPVIATQAELNHLEAHRPAPAAEPHLTPIGPQTAAVHERVNAFRESRVTDLQDRLQRAREGMETDHAFAVLGGRARADFERSR